MDVHVFQTVQNHILSWAIFSGYMLHHFKDWVLNADPF